MKALIASLGILFLLVSTACNNASVQIGGLHLAQKITPAPAPFSVNNGEAVLTNNALGYTLKARVSSIPTTTLDSTQYRLSNGVVQ